MLGLVNCNVILLRSSETQFECLASWREGRNSFLVGKMEHSHINKDEERFRCIMWDQELDQEGEMVTYMSISGEASCNGLYSSREGQTLVLRAGGVTSVTESGRSSLDIFSQQRQFVFSSVLAQTRQSVAKFGHETKTGNQPEPGQWWMNKYPNCNSLLFFSSKQTQSLPAPFCLRGISHLVSS